MLNTSTKQIPQKMFSAEIRERCVLDTHSSSSIQHKIAAAIVNSERGRRKIVCFIHFPVAGSAKKREERGGKRAKLCSSVEDYKCTHTIHKTLSLSRSIYFYLHMDHRHHHWVFLVYKVPLLLLLLLSPPPFILSVYCRQREELFSCLSMQLLLAEAEINNCRTKRINISLVIFVIFISFWVLFTISHTHHFALRLR